MPLEFNFRVEYVYKFLHIKRLLIVKFIKTAYVNDEKLFNMQNVSIKLILINLYIFIFLYIIHLWLIKYIQRSKFYLNSIFYEK